MRDNTKQAARRERQYEKWWRKNHHNSRSHDWLCKHAKRIAFGYALHPDHFDDIQYITKRFYKSEFRRLKYADGWCLWKVVNPLGHVKITMLNETAVKLLNARAEMKEVKSEINDKPARSPKKEFAVVRKRIRAYSSKTLS